MPSMPSATPYGPWTQRYRIFLSDGKPIRYSLALRRKHVDGWYDEVRYDSHEMRESKRVRAPHFHMKLRSGFMEDGSKALERLQLFVDTHFKAIEEVMK